MHLPVETSRDALVEKLRRMGVDQNERLIDIAFKLSNAILTADNLPSETADQTFMVLNAILWTIALLEISPSREYADHFISRLQLRHGRWFALFLQYPIDETDDLLLKLGYSLIEPILFADSGEAYL